MATQSNIEYEKGAFGFYGVLMSSPMLTDEAKYQVSNVFSKHYVNAAAQNFVAANSVVNESEAV